MALFKAAIFTFAALWFFVVATILGLKHNIDAWLWLALGCWFIELAFKNAKKMNP